MSDSFMQVVLAHSGEWSAVPTHEELPVWVGGSHLRGKKECGLVPAGIYFLGSDSSFSMVASALTSSALGLSL